MKQILIIVSIAINMISVGEQHKLKSKDLIAQISKSDSKLKIENSTIVDKLNFSTIENLIEGEVTRSTTIVKKNKRISDTIITYSQKNIAAINKDLEFNSCIFNQEIDTEKHFKNDKLNGQTITQFNGNLVFQNCLFTEEVDFSSVEFGADLVFVDCVFKGPFYLSAIRSSKKIIFKQCTFNEPCHFNNMQITKKAVWDQCVFKEELLLANTVFATEPELLNSEFKTINLRNCQIQDQPYFWVFEDDGKYKTLLTKVKYDKAFFGTKLKHHKAMTVHTSRSNWGGKDTLEKIIKLWDARARIKSDEGLYTVWGRMEWDKNQNILIVERAKLQEPGGRILVQGQKIEVDIANPSNYKIL